MVSSGMRRYRHRGSAHAPYIARSSEDVLDYQQLFGRQAPVRLEVGFGHGTFLSHMAAAHPEEDFIGIEMQQLRVTKTAHKSARLNAHNICLFDGEAHQFVRHRLPPGGLKRAYVLFSDPWPKQRHRRRRLMNRSFLLDLLYAMEEGGEIIIATDTLNYCFQVLSHFSTLPAIADNCYRPQGYLLNIPTRFPTVFEVHKKREGCTIGYLKFRRNAQALPPRLNWTPAGKRR